jgi:DNA-binding response OmpR family regulator
MNSSGQHGVLLVDSDGYERARLQRELESRGWKVWTATDESSAIRIIAERRHSIDAALVDLQLLGFQGRRVIAELETLDPPPICVMMSIGLSAPAMEAFRNLSDTPLLVKPIQPGQLDSTLQRSTSHSQLL